MKPVNRKDKDFAEQFALRFRLLMSYHDLTLKQIAERTESAVSTVGTWRNGRIPSNMETIEKLADLFGVSVNFLLEGKAKGIARPEMIDADRILRDIDALLRELGDEDVLHEGESAFQVDGEEGEDLSRDNLVERRQATLRNLIEQYFQAYLDRAARHPDGFSHTWIQLRKEFPLRFFDEIE